MVLSQWFPYQWPSIKITAVSEELFLKKNLVMPALFARCWNNGTCDGSQLDSFFGIIIYHHLINGVYKLLIIHFDTVIQHFEGSYDDFSFQQLFINRHKFVDK